MSEPRLSKFLADQELAVQVARGQMGTPLDYNVRIDAINVALSLANSARSDEPKTMRALLADAKLAENYLRGGQT